MSHNLTDKSNLILVGPAGCGKTLLAQTAAEYLGIPFGYCECRSDFEKGYTVDIVEDVLAALYLWADKSVPKAETGVVFLNQIDKLRSSGDNPRGLQVQEELLRILQGNIVRVPVVNRSEDRIDRVHIDTTDMLFIGAGAFDGLEEIVLERLRIDCLLERTTFPSKKAKRDNDSWLSHVSARDLEKYGLLPEFVTFFQIMIPLDPLDEQMLVDILTETNNSILATWQQTFMQEGIKLTFDKNAFREIAKAALELKDGVEGLNTVLNYVLSGIKSQSRNPIKTLRVTRDAVLNWKKIDDDRKITLNQAK